MPTYTGDMIRKYRTEKGLTQKKLGELCGIADSNIRKYESANQNTKIETHQKSSYEKTVAIMCIVGIVARYAAIKGCVWLFVLPHEPEGGMDGVRPEPRWRRVARPEPRE